MKMMATNQSYSDKPSSLKPSNNLLTFVGLVLLVALSVWAFDFEIPVAWYLVALKLQMAVLVGLFLRGLRRRVFFGKALSLHQSLSFEVVVQIMQFVSPLLPRKAFEAEFLVRETGLPREQAQTWIRSRGYSVWLIGSVALAAVFWGSGQVGLAVLVGFLAAAGFVYTLSNVSEADSSAAANSDKKQHAANVAMGVLTWGVECALFVWAFTAILVPTEAMLLYFGFTAIVEASPVPFALGVAQLPALLAIFTGHTAEAFVALVIFHLARLLPLLPLGIIYLARYKLRLVDFEDAGIIKRITRTHRPEGGWALLGGGLETDEELVSLVIPAYNEEQRLPSYLDDIRAYLDSRDLRAEVLIVDDGSKDGTADYVRSIAALDPRIHLVQQPVNQGKGNAVKRGVMEACGRYVLFADADGATPIEELDKLLSAVGPQAEIAIGSRRIVSSDAERERAGLRQVMGNVFYAVVNFFAVPGIRDTQCGFKLFRTDVARELFSDLVELGWAFDVELLYRAQLFGYGISEVPVNWHEVEGSKVNPVKDAIKMFIAIFRIRHHNAGLMHHAPSQPLEQA